MSADVSKNIESWSFCLLAFLLPTFPKFVPLSIALIGLVLIVQLILKRKKETWSKITLRPQHFLALLFILYLIGMIYSENMYFGWKDIEAKMSFIIFPILFGIIEIRQLKINTKLIFLYFIIGCLVSVVLNFTGAAFCLLNGESGSFRCFTSSNLAYNAHVNHISMYYGLSIFALINIPYPRPLKIIGVSLFIISIALMLSIGGYIAIFAGSLVGFILIRKRIKKLKLITVSLLGVFLLIFFVLFDEIKSNYDQMYRNIDTKEEMYDRANTYSESLLTRLVVWDVALETLNQHPLGVGTGDVKDVLINRYANLGLTKMERQKLNPHNQYLQTGVSIGYLGILLMILLLLFSFLKGLKSNNVILSAFVVMISVNMLFESFMEIQAGIIFCAFFLFLLEGSYDRDILEQEEVV